MAEARQLRLYRGPSTRWHRSPVPPLREDLLQPQKPGPAFAGP